MEEILKIFWKRIRKFWEVKRKITVTKWVQFVNILSKSFRNVEKKIKWNFKKIIEILQKRWENNGNL